MFDQGSDVSTFGLWAYALVGLFAASAAIVAVLNLAGLLRLPRGFRPTLFGFAGTLILVGGATFAFDALRSSDRSEMDLASVAEPNLAANETTGSIPVGTVYIQVPDMDARFAADAVSNALRTAGFRSPAIEVGSGGAPSRPEVRYFDPADKLVADRVASIADRAGLSGTTVRPMTTYKAPRGQVELWYPAD